MQSTTLALVVARSGRVQDGLYALLEAAPRIKMVGLVEDGTAALKLVVEHEPALVLLDVNLSEGQALAVLRQIKALRPQTRCIVLVDTIQQQERAKAAGADAGLLRGFQMTQFFAAVERLYSPRRNNHVRKDSADQFQVQHLPSRTGGGL